MFLHCAGRLCVHTRSHRSTAHVQEEGNMEAASQRANELVGEQMAQALEAIEAAQGGAAAGAAPPPDFALVGGTRDVG
jgi:hypothetical protein